jgi:hypothetical protein
MFSGHVRLLPLPGVSNLGVTVIVEVADLHAVAVHRPHVVAHASTPLGKTTGETVTATMTAKAAATVIVLAVPILGTAIVTRRMIVMIARGGRMAPTETRGKVRHAFPFVVVITC